MRAIIAQKIFVIVDSAKRQELYKETKDVSEMSPSGEELFMIIH